MPYMLTAGLGVDVIEIEEPVVWHCQTSKLAPALR
jgi:hypothetical protein